MIQEPDIVRSGSDPERPIIYQVFALGDTLLLAKYDRDFHKCWFRWNTEGSLEGVLRAHGSEELPEGIAKPFSLVTALKADASPASREQRDLLEQILNETGYNAVSQLLEQVLSIQVIEFTSSNGNITICWNANPEMEFLGKTQPEGLSTIEVKAHNEVLSPFLLSWYLNRFPPRSNSVLPPKQILADYLIRSVLNESHRR